MMHRYFSTDPWLNWIVESQCGFVLKYHMKMWHNSTHGSISLLHWKCVCDLQTVKSAGPPYTCSEATAALVSGPRGHIYTPERRTALYLHLNGSPHISE